MKRDDEKLEDKCQHLMFPFKAKIANKFSSSRGVAGESRAGGSSKIDSDSTSWIDSLWADSLSRYDPSRSWIIAKATTTTTTTTTSKTRMCRGLNQRRGEQLVIKIALLFLSLIGQSKSNL